MNKTKVVRDVIVIVIIIAIAGFLYLKRTSGPVQEDGGHGNGGHSEMDHAGMDMKHGGTFPALSDGDMVITLDETSVGSDWFDASVERYEMRFIEQGVDAESASAEAVKFTVQEGLFELVFLHGVNEFGVEMAPGVIEQREREFYGQFDTEAEAQGLLDEMGITMNQLKKMWTEELMEAALTSVIAGLNSLDPESQEAQSAYDDWVWEVIVDSEFIFTDPELELIYDEIVTQFLEPPVADEPHGAHGAGEMHGSESESTEGEEETTEEHVSH